MGVAFLKPGSNSARPPPPGGVISYIYMTHRQSACVRAFSEMFAFFGVVGMIARQLTSVALVVVSDS